MNNNFIPICQREWTCKSLEEGISINEFLSTLKTASDFIDKVAKKLNFPMKTVLSAQRYFIQYCCRNSFKTYPWEDVCIACLFLASKVNDTCKKIRVVLLAAFYVKMPEFEGKNSMADEAATAQGTMMEAFRKLIVGYERLVLESIDFSFEPERTFEALIRFGKYFGLSKQDPALEAAWNCLLKAYKTPLCVKYPNELLALYAIGAKCHWLLNDLKRFFESFMQLPLGILSEMQEDFKLYGVME